MASLNKVMIIGNLGTDPEMRFTANGSAVTTFRVAASRNYTSSDGERREDTEWFNIVTWNKLAENCSQFLQKGRRVYVEGRLQTRSWEKPDGTRGYRTEVNANTVLFLDRTGGGDMTSMEDFGAPVGAGDIEVDDLPFDSQRSAPGGGLGGAAQEREARRRVGSPAPDDDMPFE